MTSETLSKQALISITAAIKCTNKPLDEMCSPEHMTHLFTDK